MFTIDSRSRVNIFVSIKKCANETLQNKFLYKASKNQSSIVSNKFEVRTQGLNQFFLK